MMRYLVEECEYCGEQYFKAQALKRIEADFNRIYYSGKKPTRAIQVPMEEFVDIAKRLIKCPNQLRLPV